MRSELADTDRFTSTVAVNVNDCPAVNVVLSLASTTLVGGPDGTGSATAATGATAAPAATTAANDTTSDADATPANQRRPNCIARTKHPRTRPRASRNNADPRSKTAVRSTAKTHKMPSSLSSGNTAPAQEARAKRQH